MPETLKRLIDIIAFLPWIGERTAAKLAFFLLKSNHAYVENFSRTLHDLQEKVIECSLCHGMTDSTHPLCRICDDTSRDMHTLCIVEDYLDMIALERFGVFRGRYHILWGAISPIHGILPANLTLTHLFERIHDDPNIEEIIIATNPNIEGEATTLYITENMPRKNIHVTRLSKWLPHTGSIEFADEVTLLSAFRGRR